MPRSFGRSNSRSRSSGSSSRSSNSSSRPYGYSSSSSGYQSKPQTIYSGSSPSRSSGIFGTGGGIGSTVAHGMAFGGGSEIGHHLTRSMVGGHGGSNYPQVQQGYTDISDTGIVSQTNNQQSIQNRPNPCLDFNYKFVDCLKESGNDISKCQSIFDDLKACEKKFY
jgi:hypothetical protein